MRRVSIVKQYLEIIDIPDDISDEEMLEFILEQSSKIKILKDINIIKIENLEDKNYIDLPDNIEFSIDNGISDYED